MASDSPPPNQRPQPPAALKVALGLVILFLVVNLFLHVLNNEDTNKSTLNLTIPGGSEPAENHLSSDPVVSLLSTETAVPPTEEPMQVENVNISTPRPQQRSPADIERIKQQAQTIQVPVMAIVDDIPQSLQATAASEVKKTSIQSHDKPSIPKQQVTAPKNHKVDTAPSAQKSGSRQDQAKAYHEYLHEQAKQPSSTRSASTPKPSPISKKSSSPSVHSTKIARVYIHIRARHQSRTADSTARLLKQHGFDLPDKELLNRGPSSTQVRYFRSSDKSEAQHIANLMSKHNLPKPEIRLIEGYAHKTPPRQFEIWFSPNT